MQSLLPAAVCVFRHLRRRFVGVPSLTVDSHRSALEPEDNGIFRHRIHRGATSAAALETAASVRLLSHKQWALADRARFFFMIFENALKGLHAPILRQFTSRLHPSSS